MKIFQGILEGKDVKVAVVISRFNEFITNKLLGGAQDCLVRHGVADDAIEVFWVPGSLEIPVVAKRAAESKKYDAVVCLGAVIRGQTPHFDYVASECAKGVAAVALSTGVPTIFGVITAETIEQAIERAGTKAGNRGADAALAAIEMVNLVKQM